MSVVSFALAVVFITKYLCFSERFTTAQKRIHRSQQSVSRDEKPQNAKNVF